MNQKMNQMTPSLYGVVHGAVPESHSFSDILTITEGPPITMVTIDLENHLGPDDVFAIHLRAILDLSVVYQRTSMTQTGFAHNLIVLS